MAALVAVDVVDLVDGVVAVGSIELDPQVERRCATELGTPRLAVRQGGMGRKPEGGGSRVNTWISFTLRTGTPLWCVTTKSRSNSPRAASSANPTQPRAATLSARPRTAPSSTCRTVVFGVLMERPS